MLAVVESRNVDQCPVSATIFRTVGQVCGYFIPTTCSELQGLAKGRGAREGKVKVVLTHHNPPLVQRLSLHSFPMSRCRAFSKLLDQPSRVTSRR